MGCTSSHRPLPLGQWHGWETLQDGLVSTESLASEGIGISFLGTCVWNYALIVLQCVIHPLCTRSSLRVCVCEHNRCCITLRSQIQIL